MLFQLNPSSSMIINRARLTSAAGETRDRVNDTNARRSSLVRLKTDCMLHIVLLKSMLHNTSYLMGGPVYPSKLSVKGIESQIPEPVARRRINDIIFDELVYGRFEESSRRYFQEVLGCLAQDGCTAVVLGCTEIPLLISDSDSPLPILDSTRILARAALREATRDATTL